MGTRLIKTTNLGILQDRKRTNREMKELEGLMAKNLAIMRELKKMTPLVSLGREVLSGQDGPTRGQIE